MIYDLQEAKGMILLFSFEFVAKERISSGFILFFVFVCLFVFFVFFEGQAEEPNL